MARLERQERATLEALARRLFVEVGQQRVAHAARMVLVLGDVALEDLERSTGERREEAPARRAAARTSVGSATPSRGPRRRRRRASRRVRVTVGPEGRVESVRLVSDPGWGFGAAAVRCARAARFGPALDLQGRPVRASSPPIRVRFSR
jgi:TonB family protein